jgi:hypothetical protein
VESAPFLHMVKKSPPITQPVTKDIPILTPATTPSQPAPSPKK